MITAAIFILFGLTFCAWVYADEGLRVPRSKFGAFVIRYQTASLFLMILCAIYISTWVYVCANG